MDLKLHNTLTGKKEVFKPIETGHLKFYQCGPTVYWTQHIGNLRAMVMADLMERTFQYLDYDVKFVRNYTDVGHLTSDGDEGEDKIEKSAKKTGLSPAEISQKYIKIFEADNAELNNLEPTKKPKATENIPEIIEMVKIMLEKGFAYQTELAIYFDITKAREYNRLSHQDLEKQIQGAGAGDVNDPNKKNPSDFALWFFKKGKHTTALQTWDSPWGIGFPGWHIECSAFIRKYLGKTIDIHMGGIEHISIHHSNEIAQSEAVNDTPLANYWLHNEHLLVDNKKMSKSEGTSFSLQEIKEKGFDPLALRYFFLGAHYRSKQNFTWEALEAARNGLNNLRKQIKGLTSPLAPRGPLLDQEGEGAVSSVSSGLPSPDQGEGSKGGVFEQKFTEAITDDFNIPKALAILQEILKSDLDNQTRLATILDFDKVLGLKFAEELSKKEMTTEIPEHVLEMKKERDEARATKNWQRSDELRKEIEREGYVLEDKGSESIIKRNL